MRLLATLAALLLPCAAAVPDGREKADGVVPLFNGKDLAGWRVYGGKADNWSAEGGMIVCHGRGGGWLGTTRDYADFEVRLEYRLRPGGNSGLYVRAPQKGHISRAGMEIQILDDNAPEYARLDFYQYTGSLYHVVAPTRRMTRPAGRWNRLAVRVEDRRLQVWVNGVRVVDADLDRCRRDPAVAREHPGLARASGRIGLQSHTDRVEFRALRVREIRHNPQNSPSR
jgi:hypothetical protein